MAFPGESELIPQLSLWTINRDQLHNWVNCSIIFSRLGLWRMIENTFEEFSANGAAMKSQVTIPVSRISPGLVKTFLEIYSLAVTASISFFRSIIMIVSNSRLPLWESVLISVRNTPGTHPVPLTRYGSRSLKSLYVRHDPVADYRLPPMQCSQTR